MAINIDPSNNTGIVGGIPASKKKQSITAAGNTGPKIFDMREGGGDESYRGVILKDDMARLAASVINESNRNDIFSGDPRLKSLVDKYMSHITGEKSFTGGNGARYGFIGILARRLPAPIIFDDPNMEARFGTTMCVDPSGRMWINAAFFKKLLEDEAKGKTAVLPIFNHEHLHIALDHQVRMKSFDHMLANIAMDRVINPMVKKLYKEDTKFPEVFANAYGNRKEDARFLGLAEETILKMMLSEMAEKGTIKIGTLTIVDGPVTGQVTYKAGKDEINDLGDITVTVEDKGATDVLDTIFDCGIISIDKIDNQLKPRNRPNTPGTPGKQEDKPIMIPNVNPDNILEGLGDPSAGGDPSDHMMTMDEVIAGLKESGHADMIDDLKLKAYDPSALGRAIEQSMGDAQQEQQRIGQQYPGAHIEAHMNEVVKPSAEYTVAWYRRVKDFLMGTGPLMSRSIDEPGIITMIDPKDMGMTDDDYVYMAGLLPQAPDDVYVVMIDTSGSVDKSRLSKFISVAIAARASADDMSPRIMIFNADTVIRGEPTDLDDDALADIAENGFAFGGRGGTCVIQPLNQLMAYARENDIKIGGVLYCTDLGIFDMDQAKLPEDLPPLMFLAIPEDYKACASFVKSVEGIAEVVIIDKNMELNFEVAEANASNRGAVLSM
jgi:predicted metal-dependent peptidase